MVTGLGGRGAKRERAMPIHTPSMWIFILALVLAVLALIGALVHIPYVSEYAVWIAIVAYVVLAVGCVVKTT
jgi:hypothetical protein